MRENSIYTITPPDMHLAAEGPTITVISTNTSFVEEVERIHENMFKTVPVNIYHCNGPVTDENLAWTLSVMRLSDNVFVDLDTCNELGLVTSLVSESNTVYISETKSKKGIIKLFNSMRDSFTVYESPEDYMQIMLSQYSSIL